MTANETADGQWWPIPRRQHMDMPLQPPAVPTTVPSVEPEDAVPYRQRLEATIEAAEAELTRLDEQEATELRGGPSRHVITRVAHLEGGLGYEIHCSECGRLGVSGSGQPSWAIKHRRRSLDYGIDQDPPPGRFDPQAKG